MIANSLPRWSTKVRNVKFDLADGPNQFVECARELLRPISRLVDRLDLVPASISTVRDMLAPDDYPTALNGKFAECLSNDSLVELAEQVRLAEEPFLWCLGCREPDRQVRDELAERRNGLGETILDCTEVGKFLIESVERGRTGFLEKGDVGKDRMGDQFVLS